MKEAPKRRGRPPKAAQTLDDALHAVHWGMAPKRPRNDFERQAAGSRQPGPKPDPTSKTQIAADYAAHLVKIEGFSVNAAAAVAARALGASAANVRRYAKRKLTPLSVTLPYTGSFPMFIGTHDVQTFKVDFIDARVEVTGRTAAGYSLKVPPPISDESTPSGLHGMAPAQFRVTRAEGHLLLEGLPDDLAD